MKEKGELLDDEHAKFNLWGLLIGQSGELPYKNKVGSYILIDGESFVNEVHQELKNIGQ